MSIKMSFDLVLSLCFFLFGIKPRGDEFMYEKKYYKQIMGTYLHNNTILSILGITTKKLRTIGDGYSKLYSMGLSLI